MRSDGEAQMIGFYLVRGHSLKELMSLSTVDKLFYYAAMTAYLEEVKEAYDG